MRCKNYTRSFICYSFIAIAMAMVTACYDDEGNYDYHELDAVAIDTTDAGIQSA